MNIRKAKKGDIDDILKLADQLRRTEVPLDKTKNLKADSYLSDEYRDHELKYIVARSKIFLVAEDNGQVIGYVNGYINKKSEIYYKEPVAYLDCLCVDKTARKRGIGKKLIDEFCNVVKKKGARYVKLNAFENNIPAVSLYKKEGFEEYSIYYMKRI